MNTPPTLEAGDCIHIAIPLMATPQERYNAVRNHVAAYGQNGVRIFNVDHSPISYPQIISVVKGVPLHIEFALDPATFGPGVKA